MKNFGISLTTIKAPDSRTEAEKARDLEIAKEQLAREEAMSFSKAACQYYVNKLNSCSTKGIEFKLTADEVFEILRAETCAYSGTKFSPFGRIDRNANNGRMTATEVTLERINPCVGYIPGNVVAVTNASNGQKSNLDQFVKESHITDEMKIKLLRKAVYQLEKKVKVKK